MSRRKKRKQSFKGWLPSKAEEDVSPGGEARRRSGGRWKWIAALTVLAVAIPGAAVSAFLLLPRSGEPSGPPRAAIVDQLGLTFPNPEFVQEATATLEQAGHVVDYFPGEQVTVDLYRSLPERDYDYLIFRVHTAQFDKEWRGKPYNEPVLFTSEPYSATEYIGEQWEMQLNPAFVSEGAPKYFAVAANFIESGMSGQFDDATVILMGCGSLQTERTAEAFVNKGADAVVGWSDLVSTTHTDAVTQLLLSKLIVEGLPVEAAVAQTMSELGPDPAYKSVLQFYPSQG
ncbi:MAG: hypothetical protein A2148_01215 [Chloroflexi bacterium RBG_16_68_14]|nr:MAG: hypothetical protein A2148_01215 [Chloroflexi bacterium RBG_16_68_14]